MLVLYPRTKVSCVSQEHFPTYKQSDKNYTAICLTFNPAITTFAGKTVRQFCNQIAEYHGDATIISEKIIKPGQETITNETTKTTTGGFNKDF